MFFRLKNWAIEHARDIAFGVFIFLVITISFALGYLSARDGNRAPIVIEKQATSQ